MFNKQAVEDWKSMAEVIRNTFSPEVVLALIEHIHLQDDKIEDLIRQVEFYENQTERESINDDYYS